MNDPHPLVHQANNTHMIENDCGRFFVDASGMLVRYTCSPDNCWSLPPREDTSSLHHLHIPEGVRILPPGAFAGYSVHADVAFPDSLKRMGRGAFTRCRISRVTMPVQAALEPDVFAGSILDEIILPPQMSDEAMRRAAHVLRLTRDSSGFMGKLTAQWPKAYADIFAGDGEPRESLTAITNASGVFYTDSDGFLQDFTPHPANCISGKTNELYHLVIPEGVTAIRGRHFDQLTVRDSLSFPRSLVCFDTSNRGGAPFVRAVLPDVVLPENLRSIGNFSFGSVQARSLTIPASLRGSLYHPYCVREFKDSSIRELRVPAEYRSLLADACRQTSLKNAEYGMLHDPVLGDLCFVRVPWNAFDWQLGGTVVPRLLIAIAGQ
ncbi:MAG: leucine-rich repeat protein [Clostridia bacterium]|nr:leucine-rich repeat protein [Clostridia bacterium]